MTKWFDVDGSRFNLKSPPMYSPLDIPVSPKQPFTDYNRWRLRVSELGRHTWHYLRTDEECNAWPQTVLDKYWLGMPTVSTKRRLVPMHLDVLLN